MKKLLLLAVAVGCGGDPEIVQPTPPPPTPPPSPLEVERAALEALYNATGGASWTRRDNWLSAAPVDDWHGLATHPSGRVHTIDLRSNGLTGSIPPEIEAFEDLVGLILGDNVVAGSIPPEIGRLARLEYLDLGGNGFTGAIPSLGNRLVSIRLLDNQLTGSIPAALGRLSSLQALNLSDNEITGSIPSELGQLSRLKLLDMRGNALTGVIPPELGRLSQLEHLYLGNNGLTGAIPPELGRLSRLEHIGLASNDLAGALPMEIGDLRRLEWLLLAGNPNLSGLMPRTLLNLRELVLLNARRTQLCAPLDRAFSRWLERVTAAVEECDVAVVERLALEDLFNATAGDAWANAAGWKTDADLHSWHGVTVEDGRVRSLLLADNGLQGPFPTALVTLANLERLDMSGNELAGSLPADIGHMSSLAALELADNADLDGLLPFSMVGMEALTVLRYRGTALCIPPTRGFEAWVAGLDVLDGSLCTDLPGVALALPMAYLVQSVQQPASPVPMVANRDALLRVFMTAPTLHDFVAPPVIATFSRRGKQVYQVRIDAPTPELPARVSQGRLDASFNAVIPAEHIQPGLEFHLEADPDGSLILTDDAESRFPPDGTTPIDVVDVPPMELTVVPVLNATAPDSSIFEYVADVSADSHIVSLLRWAFPFGAFEARTRETYVTSRDLTTEEGRWGLILDLEAVRGAENGSGYYYAATLSKTGLVRGFARLGGWVSMGKPLAAELAHEVGHSLNLRHAPCGDASDPDPDFPHASGGIGAWGYDFRDGTVVYRGFADVMGYCDPAWLSDYSYQRVLDHRRHGRAGGSQRRSLVLSGGVVGGTLALEPPYWLPMAPLTPSRSGPYRLEGFLGADLRFSLGFVPSQDKFGNKYFLYTVPVEQGGVDRIVLSGPEGEAVVDEHDARTITIVRDESGVIRGMLRDRHDDFPAALGHADDLDVVSFRGLRTSGGPM